MQPTVTSGLVEAALAIAEKRRDILTRLRSALEQGKDAEALEFARQLCGLENDEARNRVN